eukprot:736414-Amorphochlora_amoeboformis.AAC.1
MESLGRLNLYGYWRFGLGRKGSLDEKQKREREREGSGKRERMEERRKERDDKKRVRREK